MATFTTRPGHPFPAGTSVAAYEDIGQKPEGTPNGLVAADTSPVGTDASLSFDNLVEGKRYYAVAQVGGTYRWVGFRVPAVPDLPDEADFARGGDLVSLRDELVGRLDPLEDVAEYSVRDFTMDGLSPNGPSTSDSTTAINNAIAAAEARANALGLRQVALKGFEQATYMIGALLHRPKVKLLLDEARFIRRADVGAPMIRNQASSYASGFTDQAIIGGEFDPNGFGSSNNGNIIQLFFTQGFRGYGTTVLLNNPVSDPKSAYCVGGRNGKLGGIDVLGGTETFEGGIWIIHGQDWTVLPDCYVEAGDDCFIVENDPGSSQMVASPDPLRRIYIAGRGKSERGHLLRVLVDASQGAVSSPDWEITDVEADVQGTAARLSNGGARIEDESAGATQLVKRVKAKIQVEVGSTSHNDVSAHAIYVDNAYDVEVDLTAKLTEKAGAVNGLGLARVIDSDDVTLDLKCDALGHLQAVDVDNSSRLTVKGRVRCTSALAFSAVRLHNTPDVDTTDLTILDVPDGKHAIQPSGTSTTNSGRIGGKVTHAAGATTGRPLGNWAAARYAELLIDRADFNNSPQTIDWSTFDPAKTQVGSGHGLDGPFTVASAAAVTLPAGPRGRLISVTGTTNITSIVASHAGDRVTLRFAGILTFTDGSNLIIGGNLVTTADDTITLVCDGTNWYELGRSVN